ncbi:hypothetical protein N7532_008817, partial [Penicillium argentinense]
SYENPTRWASPSSPFYTSKPRPIHQYRDNLKRGPKCPINILKLSSPLLPPSGRPNLHLPIERLGLKSQNTTSGSHPNKTRAILNDSKTDIDVEIYNPLNAPVITLTRCFIEPSKKDELYQAFAIGHLGLKSYTARFATSGAWRADLEDCEDGDFMLFSVWNSVEVILVLLRLRRG